MAEKLSSTLKRTPWSLIAKAAFLGVLWFFAPRWVFFLFVLSWYFFPGYQSLQLLPPFFVSLALALVLPGSVGYAAAIGFFFLLLFGIKDLVFIDRAFACEILVIFLLSFVFLLFFSSVPNWDGIPVLFSSGFVAILFLFLTATTVSYGSAFRKAGEGAYLRAPQTSMRHALFLGLGVASFIVWQYTLVLLFIPLNIFEETALALLFSVALIELLMDYFRGRFVRHRVLFAVSILFLATVFILSTTEWGL